MRCSNYTELHYYLIAKFGTNVYSKLQHKCVHIDCKEFFGLLQCVLNEPNNKKICIDMLHFGPSGVYVQLEISIENK